MDLMNLFFVYQWYVTIDEDDNAVDNIIDDDVEWMKGLYTKLCQWVPFLTKKFLLI